MDGILRQSTAVDIPIGPFLDTDGAPVTGLTISQADVRLKKNNGNWAQANDDTAATHEENGWYEKELNATDTGTVGVLKIAVTEAGALPVWHTFQVVSQAIYDALFADGATGLLPAIPTEGEIADAVWREPIADHSGEAGSTAEQLAAAGAAGDPWATALPGSYGNGTAGKIVGDSLDAAVSSRATPGDVPSAGAIADAVWDEVLSGHLTANTAGRRLYGQRFGTTQAGSTASTIVLDASASATDDLFNGTIVSLPGNTGVAGQSRVITGYVGATQTATVSPDWASTPGSGVQFAIEPNGINPDIAAIKGKTDGLTFTVSGVVDGNVKYVNEVEVTGDGQPGTEWGPA